MSFFRFFIGVLLAAILSGCGGGGGSAGNTSGSSGGGADIPASIEVLTSANTVLSAGSKITITAFVKNKSNVGMAGQTVTFSASSGTLQAASSATDDSGAATVSLITGSDKSNRDIVVTVYSGSVSGSITIPVTGSLISLSGNGSLQAGTTATYTIRAVDSSGNAVSGVQPTVASSIGNSVGSVIPKTDSTGSSTFLYTANNSGTDTLTISGLGASVTYQVIVNAIDLSVLSPSANTQIPVGVSQNITIRYRSSGLGIASQTVTFSTTRGVFQSANVLTDGDGNASASVSSVTAGPAVVVAQIANVGQVSIPVQFVATSPASIVVQANPGAVLPNASGSANQATIEAVVRDAAGNAVANRQVNFSTLQDLSNGSFSVGNATTDLNGRAQVQFIPGATSTAANGVVIQAQVANTVILSTTTLTVNGDSLFINIGFGNTIDNLDETTYQKLFSVYVTDANGVAVGGQVVALSVIPNGYYTGYLVKGATSWGYAVVSAMCLNEDAGSYNGILDAGEDHNGNGALTPGNVVVASPGYVTTDTNGRATFNLQYGEQFAPWVDVKISARASVRGTESVSSINFMLTGSAGDFTSDNPPAGRNSPFGVTADCLVPN